MFLLSLSTFLDYFTGIKIYQEKIQKKRLFWLWLSISINLGILGFFKYYNFFAASFSDALLLFGLKANIEILQILLPIGISFYTFHGLSYVIDLYRNKIKPERNIINYAVFVSFFPLLVAGPIERASHLLPQINNKRIFRYSFITDGLRQILWGLFKKIVIADNCAQFTDIIFANTTDQSGSNLLLGAFLFSFQIYGDFSGYSDIAIGTAKLFGIELLQNFSFPYFSRNIAEFWRRWHMSLTSWFKDYVYIPLGGSRTNNWLKIRNIIIIFLLSGFWHGANWTFLAWGFIHALLFIPLLLTNNNRHYLTIVAVNKRLPSLKELVSIISTFLLVTVSWIFFRASNISQAWHAVKEIFSSSLLTIPNFEGVRKIPVTVLLLIIFTVVEWLGRRGKYAIEPIAAIKSKGIRWLLYYTIIGIIFFLGNEGKDFIYFQF
jgi:D-alanyl-lipoteichoic acid acyltransferase DltB (MBOAT superfamily)